MRTSRAATGTATDKEKTLGWIGLKLRRAQEIARDSTPFEEQNTLWGQLKTYVPSGTERASVSN